jgi:hypothetical protein
MMKKKIEIIIGCLIILFSGMSHSAEKKDMDVVLVMDSTGSMKKTDPLFLRIPAAKLFVSLLGKNDRASVVSFTDSAEILSSSVLLDSENGKNTLSQAVDKITSTGLHTNLYEALNKGIEVLGAKKRPGSEKVIVFMSDGIMDTGDPEKNKTLIEKLKTDLTKLLIDNGIKVYAIAFTGQSDTQLLERVSKQTGGFYNLAMTDRDFHLVFASIFESLKAPDMLPVSGNGFLVDRSIEEVTIVTTKDSPDTTIKLSAPDGKKYSSVNKPPDTEWFVSNNFDMMTMKKPLDGKWEILFSTGKNNKAYVITNLNLQTNFNELYPLFGQNLDVKVWLEREGKPIKEKEVLEKITISLELSNPDGETTRLQPFSAEDGSFERKIELYKAGNYKLKLVADGKTFQREKTFAFKVSDVKESQEDIKLRKSLKNPEVQIPLKNNTEDEVHWGKVIAQFMIINLAVGIIVFFYLKRRSIKKTGDVKKLLKLSAIKGLFKKKNKEQGQGEVKEVPIQQIAGEEEREQGHAENKDIQETEEIKKVDVKKRGIALDNDRATGNATETEIHGTGKEEEKQAIEPEMPALNEGQGELEIRASSEDPPLLAEQEEKAVGLQDEMNDEVHEAILHKQDAKQYEERIEVSMEDPGLQDLQETTNKKVDEINEQEQVDLEKLIEQMEMEQKVRTENKEEDNDTN